MAPAAPPQLTWAKFAWNAREGRWVYCGMTEHDELVTEFEETNAAEGIAATGIALERPHKAWLTELAEACGGTAPRTGPVPAETVSRG